MDRAIHKPSGKIVSAFKLRTDSTWIGKEREEFISPDWEINNLIELKSKGIECKVSFVNKHWRDLNGTKSLVRDHFRKETPEAILKEELGESEEHKLCEEGILFALQDDEILLNIINKKLKISELNSFELQLEEHIGKKIGDVVLTFDKEDTIVGKGIVFEVQISPQGYEKTEERTYDRVKQGYSVVWLWDGMFENFKLIDKEVKVILFRDALEQYNKTQEKVVQNYSEKIDNKIEELQQIISLIEQDGDRLKEFVKSKMYEARQIFASDVNNIFKENKDKIISDLKVKLEESIKINSEDMKKIIDDVSGKKIYDLFMQYLPNVRKDIDSAIFEQKKVVNDEFSKVLFELREKFQIEIKNKIDEVSGMAIDKFLAEELNKHFSNYKEEIKTRISDSFRMFQCSTCKKDIPLTDTQWLSGSAFGGKPYCQDCWLNEYKKTIPSIEGNKKKPLNYEVNDGENKS